MLDNLNNSKLDLSRKFTSVPSLTSTKKRLYFYVNYVIMLDKLSTDVLPEFQTLA